MKFEETGLRDTPLLRRAFAVGYAPLERAFDGREDSYVLEEADKGFRDMTVNLAIAADASVRSDHEEFAAALLAGHDAIVDMARDAQINQMSPRTVEIVVNTAKHRDKLIDLVETLDEPEDGEALRKSAQKLVAAQQKIADLN